MKPTRSSLAFAILSTLIAALVLLGWALDIEPLKQGMASSVAMNPATAVCLILLGLEVIRINTSSSANAVLSRAGQLAILVVIAVSLMKLSDHMLGTSFAIDQYLFSVRLGEDPIYPSRMAPNTTTSLLLLGLALQFMRGSADTSILKAQLLGVVVLLVALLALVGNLFDTAELAGIAHYIPMAVNTALCVGLISISVLFVSLQKGLMRFVRWHSLKTRITLTTLTLFVIGIWSLAFYTSRTLREDMERLLGEQQLTTVSILAAEINQGLGDRLAALEKVSSRIPSAMLGDAAALQTLLRDQPLLHSLFNGGVITYRLDGTAIAEIPREAGRVGTNYMDIDTVATALRDGKSSIGRPVIGKKLNAPVFGMTAPIRDAQGTVIGALAGVVNLGIPSFLDKIAASRYGKTGGYLIVSKQHRVIITGTDKRRVMEPLPASDSFPVIERFVRGYEGTTVWVNPLGKEVLQSAKGIPVTDWYLAAALPTEEAFAPVHDMQLRMLLAATFLNLLVGGLTWWMLKRRLSPMVTAAEMLANQVESRQPPQSLPITSQDEIGELIGGFNRLLEALEQREDALTEGAKKYSALARMVPVGIFHTNSEGACDYVNERYSEISGRSFEAALGDGWVNAIHPDDKVRVFESWKRTTETLQPFFEEMRFVRPDFQEVFTLVQAQTETGLSVTGEVIVLGFVGAVTDITERKQAEIEIRSLNANLEARVEDRTRQLAQAKEAAEADEQFMQVITDGIPGMIAYCNSELRYEFVNKAYREWFGKSAEEVSGAHLRDVLDESLFQKNLPFFNAALRGEPQVFQRTLLDPDGNPAYKWVSYLPDFKAERVQGFFVLVSDITELKNTQLQLEQLNEQLQLRTVQAEAANRTKSIFLANMSHELRTPMNGVMGMIDLVLRRATDPKQIDWLNKSKRSAKHLLEVINDILDISKIESERLILEEMNFSLPQTIDEVLQMQEAQAQEKGLRLSCEISPSLPDVLCGDAMRLRQILLNFTGNAIKFSERGEITVSVRAEAEDKHSVLLRIEVTDQGIGISAEQQDMLFHAFTQADGSMNRKYGGTGLGLIISKRMALLMGGDAGVISEQGSGSTFWATVRLKKDTKVVATPSSEKVDAEVLIRQRYCGHRILVVDDEPINLEIALLQLEAVDLVVDTAEDGAESIALARQTDYAAIFMDMQMPKLNGLEATQQIRQLPGYRDTPIIAMTANAFAEDKARCVEAGMSDFLIKPFNPDELFATLLRGLSRSEG